MSKAELIDYLLDKWIAIAGVIVGAMAFYQAWSANKLGKENKDLSEKFMKKSHEPLPTIYSEKSKEKVTYYLKNSGSGTMVINSLSYEGHKSTNIDIQQIVPTIFFENFSEMQKCTSSIEAGDKWELFNFSNVGTRPWDKDKFAISCFLESVKLKINYSDMWSDSQTWNKEFNLK